MTEYIDREAFLESMKRTSRYFDVKFDIESFPAADVAPVRHGRWVDGHCSECGADATFTTWTEPVYDYDWEENLYYSHDEIHNEYSETNYCPNCGAKMDLEG